MTSRRVMIAATVLNVALFLLTHAPIRSVEAQQQAGVLRAGGLEIVDVQGRVRASITVEPPTTVDGRSYPETVLLRLTDPESGPVVKLTAASDGSALGLSDEAEGGIRAYAKGRTSFLEVSHGGSRVRVIAP
jgi:hypothetical protein